MTRLQSREQNAYDGAFQAYREALQHNNVDYSAICGSDPELTDTEKEGFRRVIGESSMALLALPTTDDLGFAMDVKTMRYKNACARCLTQRFGGSCLLGQLGASMLVHPLCDRPSKLAALYYIRELRATLPRLAASELYFPPRMLLRLMTNLRSTCEASDIQTPLKEASTWSWRGLGPRQRLRYEERANRLEKQIGEYLSARPASRYTAYSN
ncbi:MAG: hypothetical protein Q9170_003631 [Blastenia crenularia]